jgi:hypothetical protein
MMLILSGCRTRTRKIHGLYTSSESIVLKCPSKAIMCEWTHNCLLNFERLFLYFYQCCSVILWHGYVHWREGKIPSFEGKYFEGKATEQEDIMSNSTVYTRQNFVVKSNSNEIRWLVVCIKVEINTAFMILVAESTTEIEIRWFR